MININSITLLKIATIIVLTVGICYNFNIANSSKYDSYGDAADYLQLGLSLAKTNNYGHLKYKNNENLNENFRNNNIANTNYEFGSYSTWRPPIWPFLISGIFILFGYKLIYLIIFKFILHVLGLYIFYRTLKLINLRIEIILIGLIFYGLNPAWQIYSRVFLSEPITLFFITLWVYLLVEYSKRRISYWPQAIIAGILILCHPYFIFLPFSIWGILFFNKIFTLKSITFSGILCVLIISIWVVRNMVILDTTEIVITTSAGAVMAKGWNSMVLSEHSNTKGDLANEGLVLRNYDYDTSLYYNELKRMKLFKDATFHFINSNKDLVLPIIYKKIISALNPIPEQPKPGILETGRWIIQFLSLVAMIYIIAFIENKLIVSLVIGLLISTILITILTYSGFRFRMPQIGIEVIFILITLQNLIFQKGKLEFNEH
tara:strand:- start:392 stop:1687 length:1296 start_codon:yes stop_codon:yes gene_type:complete